MEDVGGVATKPAAADPKAKRSRLKCCQINCSQLCEVLMLTLFVLIIIGLFSIPTVLYALRSSDDHQVSVIV